MSAKRSVARRDYRDANVNMLDYPGTRYLAVYFDLASGVKFGKKRTALSASSVALAEAILR